MNVTIYNPIGARARIDRRQTELDARAAISVAVLSTYKGVFVGSYGRPAVSGSEAPTV